MATHLVTGGSGFAGQSLVHSLLAQGHFVRSLDVLSSNVSHPRFEFFKASVLDKEKVFTACQNIDVVHHLAAAVPLVQSEVSFKDVNIRGTQLVVEAALNANIKHFNFMSSSAIYGDIEPKDCPLRENSIMQAFESYGKSKVSAEKIVTEHMSKQSIVSWTIIRPRTIVGPGRMGIFDLLFNWIRKNQNIYFLGNGENKLQFVHVKDVDHALILAAEKFVSGVFNIGAKEFGSLKETVNTLCQHANSSSKIKKIPTELAIPILTILDKTRLSPLSPWHYKTFHKDYYFDISKAETVLGWKPMYSNDQMFIEAYNWFVENNDNTTTNTSMHLKPLKKGILSLFTKSL